MSKSGTLLWRKELRHSEIRPTGFVEELLPKALSTLLDNVDKKWLLTERLMHVRLGKEYLVEPISFVGTSRIESARSSCHYYARALLTAQDFLEGRSDYDFHFGATVIPQIARLGQMLPLVVTKVSNAQKKIGWLYSGPSEEVASTIYEILVAAALVEKGRKVHFEKTGKQKTPDLRVLDMEKVVVECKRKKPLTQYEQREESIARSIFAMQRDKLITMGLAGMVEIEFRVELENVSLHDIVAVFTKLLTQTSNHSFETSWAKFSWRRLPQQIPTLRTPLYSPLFLKTVFGWSDIPTHDGIICQVEAPVSLLVENANSPMCLKWNSISSTAMQKKARAISALVGEASGQVPKGEIGIIYICYTETARVDIADLRTNLIMEQMRDWTHSSNVLLPIMFVNRLYASAVANGAPDLIENTLKLQANYADAGLLEFFPAAIFTNVG